MVRVAFLWHMHQPVYVNPYSRNAELPWVRLHGIKDYIGLSGVLKEFPGVRSTVNLVPSLLSQLENYLAGGRDRFQELAEKPAAELDGAEREFILRHFFSMHAEHMIRPFARFWELYGRRRQMADGGGTTADWRDLQVWSSLAWFDPDRAEKDERVAGLREKAMNFSEADKILLAQAQRDLLAEVIPAWKGLQDEGLVEISTSPLTHAILPLLLDPGVGREANPALPLYDLDFSWPDDARRQLSEALDFMQRRFGRRPRGIWPSEGSLSEPVLALLNDLDVAWTAGDEINLARSLHPQGQADWRGERDLWLYRPWLAGNRRLRILFRDHDLSDRIGFRYQGLNPADAADDFMRRLMEIDRLQGDAVVGVILDGENPWEHYPGNGRPFLRALLQRLQDDERVEAVTMGEAVSREAEPLRKLAPGSWINGNFDIWIGDETDRRAWAQLERARSHFERTRHNLAQDRAAEARHCLDVAQGSDWFWWYGPEHHTADLDVFDRLFRLNLRCVYELTGSEAPAELSSPLSRAEVAGGDASRLPARPLNPLLDGEVSHFFEWRDAGHLDVYSGQSAMHAGESLVTAAYYGFGNGRFYLRFDLRGRADELLRRGMTWKMGVSKAGGPVRRFSLPSASRFGTVAAGTLLECGFMLAELDLEPGDRFDINLEWRLKGRLVQALPADGFFTLVVPGPGDYAAYWQV
jgi:alpha-amylase/alpha-mannosidase (GH57 family)